MYTAMRRLTSGGSIRTGRKIRTGRRYRSPRKEPSRMPDRSDRWLAVAAALAFAACETQEGQAPTPAAHPTAGTMTTTAAPVVQAPVPATATATLAALTDKPAREDVVAPASRAEKKKG